jgi:hypothetical protein
MLGVLFCDNEYLPIAWALAAPSSRQKKGTSMAFSRYALVRGEALLRDKVGTVSALR